MAPGGGVDAEFEEDLGGVGFDRSVGNVPAWAIASLERHWAMRAITSVSRLERSWRMSLVRWRPKRRETTVGVGDRLGVDRPLERIDEYRRCVHAPLEGVTNSVGMLFEQPRPRSCHGRCRSMGVTALSEVLAVSDAGDLGCDRASLWKRSRSSWVHAVIT